MNVAFTDDLFALSKLPGAVFNAPPDKVRTYYDQIDQDMRADYYTYASQSWIGPGIFGPNETMMKLASKVTGTDPLVPWDEAKTKSWWDIAKKPKVWSKAAADILAYGMSARAPHFFEDAIDAAVGGPPPPPPPRVPHYMNALPQFQEVIAQDPSPEAAASFVRSLSRDPDDRGSESRPDPFFAPEQDHPLERPAHLFDQIEDRPPGLHDQVDGSPME